MFTMDKLFEEASATDTVAELQRKYLNRTQLPPSEDILPGSSDEARPPLISCTGSHQPNIALRYYTKALRELCTAVTSYPKEFVSDHSDSVDSSQDLKEDCNVAVFQDSQEVFTETDVTLPSCLGGSPGSPETQMEGRVQRACRRPMSCQSPSLVFANMFQEMMAIYAQLKAERQRQHRFERELQERDRRLNQQKKAFKHQDEVCQLQERLLERSKENRRLKRNFDSIKELNDNMKKQLIDIREQNKKLENQSKRVYARLINLQRKCEHNVVSRYCLKSPEVIKLVKSDRTVASMKPTNKSSSSPATLKLLAFLMDWILDSQMFTSRAENERQGVDQRRPPVAAFDERCVKVLPLLADQLHHGPVSQPELFLNLLRLIDGTLRHIDHNARHAAPSATARRIGEELAKPLAPISEPAPDYPEPCNSCSGKTGGSCHWPADLSPCPRTNVLSTLILLRTGTQADVLASALDRLHTELVSEESRGLFLRYDGVDTLMLMVRTGRGGLRRPLDILMRLTEHSHFCTDWMPTNHLYQPKERPREALIVFLKERVCFKECVFSRNKCYLNPFLDACSCEDFFQTTSWLLQTSHLDLPSLEKLSILLQKLSSIRKNRRLFELSSLRRQIQELRDKRDPEDSFLHLNLSSILLNLQ